ncbi:MAG: hypothetical protein DFNUSKGM_000171 [Candidatus Fervidibacter sacchari]
MITQRSRVQELLKRLLTLTETGKLVWRKIGSTDYEVDVQTQQEHIRFVLTLFPSRLPTGRVRFMPESAAPFMVSFRVESVSPTLLLFDPKREEPILRLQADELDKENQQLLERLYEIVEEPETIEATKFMEQALAALETVEKT